MSGSGITVVLDAGMVREAFPEWRIGGGPGSWYAVRDGTEALYGPRSLVRRYLSAPTLEQLAEKLGLQRYLDDIGPGALAEVWIRVMSQDREGPGAA